MTIHLPNTVTEEYDVDAFRTLARSRLFVEELKRIDSRLSLIWAKPNARSIEGGYWYIVRRNDHADPSYWQVNTGQMDPATGKMGYADPGPEHLDRLKQIDSHAHPRAYAEYRKRQDDDRRRGEKASADLHAEFREKLDERLKHAFERKATIFVPGGE